MPYLSHGYRYVQSEHPRSNSLGYIREHILVAEGALGKHLPSGAVVHHVNGIKDDNRPENLVICENDQYHRRLHYRANVVALGGDPDLHKLCPYCHVLQDGVCTVLDSNPETRLCCASWNEKENYGNSSKASGLSWGISETFRYCFRWSLRLRLQHGEHL